MNHIKIRPAQPDDVTQLDKLMHRLHDFHHHSAKEVIKTASEIAQQKSIARYIHDPECLVYVAQQGEHIVGFITGHFCELVSQISQPVQMGSVDELFVVEALRRQRVAEKLMEKISATFEEYGVKKIFVEVWHFNQSAINFYHKQGFTHHIHWLCKSIKPEAFT